MGSSQRPWAAAARFLVILALFLASGPIGGAAAQGTEGQVTESKGSEPAGVAPAVSRAIAYQAEIIGAPSEAIEALLRASSTLLREAERPPATPAALDRRIADDVATFGAVLRSEGYYGAEIMTEKTGEAPVAVTMAIASGPLYLFAGLDLEYRGGVEGAVPANGDDLGLDRGLDLGMVARAEPLDAVEDTLLRRLNEGGYPFADIVDTRWTVDHVATTLAGRITIDTGGFARFGPLRIEGLDQVKEGYVRALVQWRQGEAYDIRRVEAVRAVLVETGLFDIVVVEPDPDAAAPPGTVAMVARVEEHERRSISVGVAYATDEGPSAEIGWRHRNLYGNAETLRLGAIGSMTRQEGTALLSRPNVIRKGQTLEFASRIANETSDAFDELVAEQSASLSWPVGPYLRLSAGPTFAFTHVEEDASSNNFALLGFFVSSTYDDTDDPLDPTRGKRMTIRLHPNASVIGTEVGFLSGEVTASTYWSVLDDDRLVLAARGRVGSMVGAATEDIPASRRFYAGGGGSVRGFAFREVGPLRSNNDPLGGRSVVEAGIEARLRIFGDIGIVPFIDAGQVFDSSIPNAEGGILYAAGLGFRYYTPIGPVRLDIARPLNPREVDDDFQLYISIGQAF